jgi:hypothetical protein
METNITASNVELIVIQKYLFSVLKEEKLPNEL